MREGAFPMVDGGKTPVPRRRFEAPAPTRSAHQELAVGGSDGTLALVLPRDHAHVRDATPELEDLAACAGLARTGRAQVVHREADGSRYVRESALVDEAQERGQLEERPDHAAVDRR